MKKIPLLLLASIVLSASSFGQGASSGMSVLKIPQSARIAGSGALAVSELGNLGASLLNPAALMDGSSGVEVAFTHISWIQGTSANSLQAAVPLPFGRFSLATGSLSVEDVEVRTQPGPPLATFNAQTGFVRGGFAAGISEGIFAGVGASYIYDRMYAEEATGWGFDGGVVLNSLLQDLTVGASVTHAGSLSGYGTKETDLPTQLTAGARYSMLLEDVTLRPALAVQQTAEQGTSVNAGLAVSFMEFFTVRGGWRTGDSARKTSLGASFAYMGAVLDYAFLPLSDGLGSGHFITISVDL